MLKQACMLCKIVGLLAIVGALNWGLIGLRVTTWWSKYLAQGHH